MDGVCKKGQETTSQDDPKQNATAPRGEGIAKRLRYLTITIWEWERKTQIMQQGPCDGTRNHRSSPSATPHVLQSLVNEKDKCDRHKGAKYDPCEVSKSLKDSSIAPAGHGEASGRRRPASRLLQKMRHELFDANNAQDVMKETREAVTPAASDAAQQGVRVRRLLHQV